MHCPKCAAKVESALSDRFDVSRVTVSHETKKATLVTAHELDGESMTALISSLGFTVTTIETEEEQKKSFFQKLFKKG